MLFIVLLTLSTVLYSQTSNYTKSGDPKDSSWPGGYIGLGFEFDLKTKQRGYQLSFGVAVPDLGEPGMGPFIFPGIAIGKKYLLNEKKSYTYIDMQIVAIAGLWGGAGYGIAFKDGKTALRRKFFAGWIAGYVNESTQVPDLKWVKGTFKGYHLGLGLPLIGGHFYP